MLLRYLGGSSRAVSKKGEENRPGRSPHTGSCFTRSWRRSQPLSRCSRSVPLGVLGQVCRHHASRTAHRGEEGEESRPAASPTLCSSGRVRPLPCRESPSQTPGPGVRVRLHPGIRVRISPGGRARWNQPGLRGGDRLFLATSCWTVAGSQEHTDLGQSSPSRFPARWP